MDNQKTNELSYIKSKRCALVCALLALTLTLCVLPLGLIHSFAAVTQSESESKDGQMPEYNPDDYQTSDEIKGAIDSLKASLDNIDGLKNELYIELEQAIQNKEEIESSYLAQKLEADAEIQLIEIKLGVFEEIISQYDLLISNKQKDIDNIEKQYEDMYRVFAERLRQSYEEGVPGTLEIFLNSESFIEMLTSIERMKDILEHDTGVMDDLERIKLAHIAEKKELEDYHAQQKTIVLQLEEGRADLEKKLEQSLEILNLQENNIDEYLLLLEIADQNRAIMNDRIEQAVKDYYAQLDKEEQKEYQLTEEYKRIYVQPDIIKKMESGAICKGGEYFEGEDEYIWPLAMKYYKVSHITSDFGWRTYTNSEGKKVTSNHKGYDIGVPAKNEIYAIKSGTVIIAAYSSSYGYYVVVLHDDQTKSVYAHCSKLLAEEGEFVLQGEAIALVGSTGQSTGNHLHIEIQINSKAEDPSLYITMPTKNKEN